MKTRSENDCITVNNDGSFTVDRDKLHETDAYKKQVEALKKLIDMGFLKTSPGFRRTEKARAKPCPGKVDKDEE